MASPVHLKPPNSSTPGKLPLKKTDATQQRDEHRARPARTPIPAPTHGAGTLLAAARGRRDGGTEGRTESGQREGRRETGAAGI